MFTRTATVLMLGIMATGCTDKAKEPYDLCLKVADLKSDDHYAKALDYCQTAIKNDPDSKSGKAAAAKIPELEQGKKEQDDKIAAAKAAQLQAEAATRAAQDAEDAKCSSWVTICTLGRFPDGSEQTTGLQHFKTKAKCESIGKEMGGIPCDPCRCTS
jgi:hypothetical protein